MPTRTHQPRRRLARPPSKQILQLREEDGDVSPYPCSSSSWTNLTDASSNSVSRALANEEDEEGGAGDPANKAGGGRGGGKGSNACGHYHHDHHHRHASSVECGAYTKDQHDDEGDKGVPSTHPHSTNGHGDDSGSYRRGPHVTHRAMTASARRGGKSAHANRSHNGGSSSSNSKQRVHSSSSCTRGRASTSTGSRSNGASPVVSGGHVVYYGSPSSRLPPATAALSPAPSSPSLADVSASTVSSPSRTTLNASAHSGDRPLHNSEDAGTAPLTPPGAAGVAAFGSPTTAGPALASTTANTSASKKLRNGGSFSFSDASRCGCDDGSPASAEALHSTPGYTGTASPSSVSMHRAGDTPLTYAAVASTPSPSSTHNSSLHGKRLPQSRVNFGNFRKRVGASAAGSCAGSVGSTVCSTIGTPATAGTPVFVTEPSILTAGSTTAAGVSANGHAAAGNGDGAAGRTNGSCGGGGGGFSLYGFPSVPLTPLAGTNPSVSSCTTTTSNTSRATEKIASSPSSPAPLTVSNVGGGDGVGGGGVDDAVESEEDEEGDTRGFPDRQPSDYIGGSSATKMPPIPPSLHRNHPTNLFLQLPPGHACQPDSDEEDGCYCPAVPPPRKAASPRRASRQNKKNNNNGNGTTPAEADPCPIQSAAIAKTPCPAQPSISAAQCPQSAIIQDELNRCATSSTRAHTGPAVAAKAAAGLQLMPLTTNFNASMTPTTTPASSTAPPSSTQTPIAPTLPRPSAPPSVSSGAASAAANAALDVFNRYCSNSEATPTGPAPPTFTTTSTAAAGRGGMHKVSSTMSFFNAAEIIPGLFLGSYSDATDTEVLAAQGISLVINCSLECQVTPAMANNPHHVRFVQCPLRDHSDEAISPFFTPVTQIIHEQLHRRQILQQRMNKKTTTTTTTGGHAGTGSASVCGGGGTPATAVSARSGRDADEDETIADRSDGLQERMGWTWADEAENVWAVPTSPASPPLSVGGQPSLKEGKRETPRTPSSVVAGAWGRGSEGTASVCTSGSPSPMPGRTATFPGLATPALPSASTPANAADPLVSTGAAAAAAVAALRRTTSAQTLTNTTAVGGGGGGVTGAVPLTVVDPRDCGSVLVHCRMGVSRSATFVMAYLILYGFTLATLDDTASLFLRFLERERSIIEDAGGRARFNLENGSTSKIETPTTTATAAGGNANTAAGACCTPQPPCSPTFSQTCTVTNNNNNNALRCGTSGTQSSQFSTTVSSPTNNNNSNSNISVNSTPTTASLGVRRPLTGFASWYQQRTNSSLNSTSTSTTASPSMPCHRRSAAIPVSSPLFLGGPVVSSPRSTASSSQLRLYTPATPLEVCSRVCRPCFLQRLRERRLQQQSRRGLLISGQQQQEMAEEQEEQMMALAAVARTRGMQRQGSTSQFASPTSGSSAADLQRCFNCGDNMAGSNSNSNKTATNGNCKDAAPISTSYGQTEGERCPREAELRPTPSSAPVMSYRSARGGSFGVGAGQPTLLEAALADESHVVQDGDDGEAGEGEDGEGDGDGDGATAEANDASPTLSPPPITSAATVGVQNSRNVSGHSGGQPTAKSVNFACGPPPWRNNFSVSNASTSAESATAAANRRLSADGASGEADTTSTSHHTRVFNSTSSFTAPPRPSGTPHGVDLTRGPEASGYKPNAFLYGSCDNSSIASSHSVYSGDLAPAMTFREAFDAVKKQKSDVNPNIGFVLALRELAGGGDFSFSTSL